MKKILHLVTQRNQPIGSRRKCCERCGLAIFAMDEKKEGYTEDENFYEKDIEEFKRCNVK